MKPAFVFGRVLAKALGAFLRIIMFPGLTEPVIIKEKNSISV